MQINSMELKESVIMDITEAFRGEDISKTDFFDFVVTPDSNDSHSIQQFTKQMRTVNAYLSNGSPGEKETNNNTTSTNNMLTTELSSQIPPSTDCVTSFDASFWCDKDTVKLETAILEDLNKYCWSTDEPSNSVVQNTRTNTDGHIYTTLTVLNNGIEPTPTWYRPPLAVVKEEDSSMSSPHSMELQSNLDIDSILSIIPEQMNGYNNNYNENNISPNTDGLIKSETYTYEDSGFADNKEELANSLIIDTPLLEAHDNFNNNNNDWKLTNQNTTNNGAADSLLRSALQGKAFVRYNGNIKIKTENNSELRRALSTPTTKSENNNIYLKDDSEQHIPTIVAGIDADGKVIFEEHISNRPNINEHENPSSTHSMNELLLCQLEQYPDDFEKLKRIADEVAESVNQFCQIDTSLDNTIYSISPDQIGILHNLNTPLQIPSPVVTSTKQTTKKYKRSNSSSKSQTTVQNATSTNNGIRKERSLHYCSICSKGFKDKYSVNVHIRTHTGEKPFACSLCGKSFRQKAHLAKHYQTHIAQKNAAAAGNVATNKAKPR